MSFKVENVLESSSSDRSRYESSISVLSRYSNYTQNIPSGTNTKVSWWELDTSSSVGNTGLEISEIDSRFTNTSNKAHVYSVSGYIGWNIGASPTTVRNCYIAKSGDVLVRLGYTSIQVNTTTAFPITNFTGTVVLQPGEYFNVYVFHNDSSTQSINDEQLPGSRITIIKL